MKFCTDCWNFDRCNAIGRVVDFSVDDGVCRYFDECKPQTNADRIRSMSDEELADMLWKTGRNYRAVCADPVVDYNEHRDHLIAWLQQPAG